MIKLLLLQFFVFCSAVLMAQTKEIKGKIIDENKTPVAGANVSVKNSTVKTQTKSDGTFSLTTEVVNGKVTLVVSNVGYNNATSVWTGAENTTITLDKKIITDEDVVVVGYNTVKRKNLTSAVSSVTAKDLKDVPINSAAEALNGRLAGVTATTAEGSPDADIKIKVRGGMSITQDNSPLYIIDGVQVENALNTISPQDIQTIDVLKDASAAAIYGARGANGVILITTKAGKPGKLRFNYNTFVGVKYLPKTLKTLSPVEFVKYLSERSRGNATDSTTFVRNFGSTWDTLANYANVNPVNWQDEVFGNTGITNTHNLTAGGGNKKVTYNFGYTFNNDKAIVLNSSYKRHLFTAKADYKITKKIKVGLGARYTNQNVYGAGVSDTKGSSYNRLRNAVKYRPFLSNAQDIDDQDPLADPNVGNGLNLVNPISLTNAEYRRKTTNAINTNFTGQYNITKRLVFKTVLGYDKNHLIDRQFSDSITPYSVIQGSRKPVVALDTTQRETYTNTNTLTYTIDNYKNKHDITFLVGQETYDQRNSGTQSLVSLYPTFITPQNAFTQTNLGTYNVGYPSINKTRFTSLSFFGRVNYTFSDKYLLTLNYRADGSSKFAPGKQWGNFPGASIAWKVSSEKFMENVKFINALKFRAGYGELGNNRMNDYLYLTTFRNDGRQFYGINNQAILAYYSNALVNENLKWESNINRNIGMDVTLLKNRIDLTVDLYNNISKDLLLNVPVASTFGYTTQLQNIGKTSNKGYEIQLTAVVLKKKQGVNWTTSFNLSSNVNRIEALGTNQTSFLTGGSGITWGVSGQPADYIIKIGQPVGSMYGLVTDGFYKVSDFDYNTTTSVYTLKTGMVNNSGIIGAVMPGSIKFKDLNGDGVVDLNNDRQVIGNPTPKFTGGWQNTVAYKNWDLSAFVNFSVGNDIYNANKIEFTNGYTNTSNLLDIMKDRFKVVTETGASAVWASSTNVVYGIAPAALEKLNANATLWTPLKGAGAFTPHSWAIEDGSFLRLNNVTFGYSLPVKNLTKLKMSKLRFYVTANNLAVLTNYTGYDPEVSVKSNPLTPGLDYSAYPKSRSFIFGINASF